MQAEAAGKCHGKASAQLGWSVAAFTVVGLALRIAHLGTNSLWLDEGVSVAIARLSWPDFAALLWRREGNMALYYLLLRFWLHLGSTEFFIRLLSAIVGALLIPVLYWLGTRFFGASAGLAASLLGTINVFHIHYSQEARSYALVALFSVLASGFFAELIERPSQRARGFYIVACVLCIYSHLFGGFVVAAHALSLVLLPPRRIPRAQWIGTFAPIAIASLPLLAFMLHTKGGQLQWVPQTRPRDVYTLAVALAGSPSLLIFCAAGACIGAGRLIWKSMTRNRADVWERWRYSLALTWLLAPVILTLAVSFVHPAFVSRFLIIVLPAFILVTADGLCRLSPLWRLGALAGFVLLTVPVLVGNYAAEVQDWRGATAYVRLHASASDGIVFFQPLGRMAFDYYQARPGQGSAPAIIFPGHGDKLTRRDFEGLPSMAIAALQSQQPQHDRIWLMLSSDQSESGQLEIENAIASQYATVRTISFRGLRVLLYQDPRLFIRGLER